MDQLSPTSLKVNYLGKFAEIKKKVKLPKGDIAQVYNYPYLIVNQNKKRTWICLESEVYATYVSSVTNKATFETINRSFWMRVDECKIFDKL